jgi:5-methylcytosine-specific restriction endonuclease McrA
MSNSCPSATEQIQFLSNLQRLFSEGSFVSTYKFALLSALADIAVETGDDTGAELTISIRRIAEKFVEYYWRQSRPYFFSVGNTACSITLRQNTGREAGVLRLLREHMESGCNSLSALQSDKVSWNRLIGNVKRIVREMPLWKLQTLGSSKMEFLYRNQLIENSIRLNPGVMFGLRAFHIFITDMVRGAWIRYVRRHNRDRLGDPTDLEEFLFGSERLELSVYLPILREIQSSRCFYCARELSTTSAHVDHFIPWATYPVDLGHNFVLADSRCNNAKSDHLASTEHLQKWWHRNEKTGKYLAREFDQIGVMHDLDASQRIAKWAYNRVSLVDGQTFKLPGIFEPAGTWESMTLGVRSP